MLGHTSVVMKPSFANLAKVEAAMGRSIFALLTDLSSPRTSKVSEVVKVIHIASGGTIPLDDLGDIIQGLGFTSVLTQVFEFLSKSVGSDEVLAADAKKTVEPEPVPLAQ